MRHHAHPGRCPDFGCQDIGIGSISRLMRPRKPGQQASQFLNTGITQHLNRIPNVTHREHAGQPHGWQSDAADGDDQAALTATHAVDSTGGASGSSAMRLNDGRRAECVSGDRTVVRLTDRESGLSARTIARRPSLVSGSYAYLVARGGTPVQVNPMPRGLSTRRQSGSKRSRTVPLVRVPRTVPRILSPQEADRLLAALRTQQAPGALLQESTPRGREHIRGRALAWRRTQADHSHVPPALVGAAAPTEGFLR